MKLIRENSLFSKNGESHMGEDSLLRGAAGPVFSRHIGEICTRRSEQQAVSAIVRPHPGKGVAPGNLSFEVKNVRGLKIGRRHLVVTSVSVKPGNREW